MGRSGSCVEMGQNNFKTIPSFHAVSTFFIRKAYSAMAGLLLYSFYRPITQIFRNKVDIFLGKIFWTPSFSLSPQEVVRLPFALFFAMEHVREMTERLRRINKKNKEEEKGELYSNRRRTNRLRYFSV